MFEGCGVRGISTKLYVISDIEHMVQENAPMLR